MMNTALANASGNAAAENASIGARRAGVTRESTRWSMTPTLWMPWPVRGVHGGANGGARRVDRADHRVDPDPGAIDRRGEPRRPRRAAVEIVVRAEVRRLHHHRTRAIAVGGARRRVEPVGGGDDDRTARDPSPGRGVDREERPIGDRVEGGAARALVRTVGLSELQ